jgi:hypothetical protein
VFRDFRYRTLDSWSPQVRSSVRRLHFALASGCPNKIEFEMAKRSVPTVGGPRGHGAKAFAHPANFPI